jgi:hypothetical protein
MENKLYGEVVKVAEEHKTITITNGDELSAAAELLQTIKGLIGKVKDTFDPIVKKAHAAHKEATTQRKKHLDPLEEADATIRRAITRYTTELERKAREEAEAKRIEAEEAQQEASEKAKEAEESGDHFAADTASVVDHFAADTADTVSTPKVDGLSFRTVIKYRVVDEGAIPREYLLVNDTKIKNMIRALGNETNIPGIELYEEQQTIVR